MPKTDDSSSRAWSSIIDQYMRLRDLEHPAFLQEAQQLIKDLRHDATALYQVALRLELRARTPVIDLTDFGAGAIRHRLTARSYGVHHLRLTEDFLDRLSEQVPGQPGSLRRQAWCLDVAAESVAVWIEIYLARREDLRRQAGIVSGNSPSVGLDYLIGATLDCRTAEIATHLVDAGVLPERESEEGDLRTQWKRILKRARRRYRERGGP